MDIEFVYGKGDRKIQQQRDCDIVTSYIAKGNEYSLHLKICVNKRSALKQIRMQHLWE